MRCFRPMLYVFGDRWTGGFKELTIMSLALKT